jgi:hypothetical protein
MALKVNIRGAKSGYIQLMFHKRWRNGDSCQRHPTLDEAVATFKNNVTFPEYQEKILEPAKEEA